MQKGTRMKSFIRKIDESLAVWLFGNALSTQLLELLSETLPPQVVFSQKAIVQDGQSSQVHVLSDQTKLKLQRASASAAAHDADAAQVALTGCPWWLVRVSVDEKMVQTYMVVVMQKARRMKSLSCAWLRCRCTGRARLGKPRPQQTGWTHCSREGFQPWDVTTLHDFFCNITSTLGITTLQL